MYFVGIDGGGTHSRLLACDESGRFFGPYTGGSTNLSTNQSQVVVANLQQLLDQFLAECGAQLDQIAALCIGSAGVDVPDDEERMVAALHTLGLECPVRAVNDVEIVLESETVPGEPGVVLIAGTGSVALGKNAAGETHRTGGWGHLVGDEGSGYWMASEAIRYVLKGYDGRKAPTVLSDLLCAHFGTDNVPDIIQAVYSQDSNKSEIGAAANWVDIAAERGDAAAIQILTQATEELFELAEASFHRLDLPRDTLVVLSGGTMENSEPLRLMLTKRLEKLTSNTKLAAQSPCLGAVQLARQLVNA